jgi:hypothetical protein
MELFELEVVTSNAAQRLGQLANQAQCLRAAVAYWTLPPRCLDPELIRALSHKGSFLCTDVHSPTSIDELAEFRKEGANIFLYLYSLSGKTEVKSAKGVPNHLLHSKVFLFDCLNDRAFAWIGSHNGTYRALHDINTECSVVVTLEKHSSHYEKIEAHLEAIRRKSTAFDLGDLEYYKMLQWQSDGDLTIEVEDVSRNFLQLNSKITIFGCVPRDFQGLKSVDKSIYLAVTNSDTEDETFYKATIDQVGNLDKGESLKFPARRYAMRDEQQLPELCSHGEIPEDIYKRARYFITVTIQGRLPKNTRGLEVERRDVIWEDSPIDVFLEDKEGANKSKTGLVSVDKKKLRVKQPASKMKVLCDMAMSFDDRKKLKDHALIRKRIIVPG